MALSNYSRVCAKNTPGNFAEVYLAAISRINSVTESSSEISAVSMASSTPSLLFQMVQADIDSVQYTIEGSGATSYQETGNLIFKCSGLTKELIELQHEIASLLPCGLAAIHVDNNGEAYISGISTAAKEGKLRPYTKATFAFDSGTKPDDEGMNSLTVTLTRQGKYGLTPFIATSQAKIVTSRDHAAINWPS